MKHLRLISLLLIFIGCNSPNEELTKSFNNHLTNEQIELIIQINQEYDEFLFNKFPEAKNNLDKAYRLLSETIATQGGYDDYILPTEKLKSFKSKLIETGFYKELYTDSKDEYRINYDGQYLKCLEELGHSDKDLKNYYEAIAESGQRFHITIGIGSFIYLSDKNQIDSMKKLLLTFDLVLWQIEIKTGQQY
jgi:hypothetical protein